MFRRRRRRRQLRQVRPGDGSALKPFRFWQLLSRSVFYLDLPEQQGGRGAFAVDVHFLADELDDDTSDWSDAGSDEDSGSDDSFWGDLGLGDLGLGGKGSDGGGWGDLGLGGPEPGGTDDADRTTDVPRGSERSSSSRGRTRSSTPPAAVYRDGAQLYRADVPATFPVPGGVIEVATSMYGLTRMHYVTDDGRERPLRPDDRTGEGLRARFGRRHPVVSRIIGVAAVLVLLVSLAVGAPQILELVTSIDLVADRIGTFTSPISLPEWANAALLGASVIAALERALTLRNHWLIDADTIWLEGA